MSGLRYHVPGIPQAGRLGCPHDYTAFVNELEPLLVNIHGETAHTGKVPRRCAGGSREQTQLIRLRREMKEAVAAEQYEKASQIRDEIRRLEKAPPSGGGVSSST
jgi:protein arginine kinase activator